MAGKSCWVKPCVKNSRGEDVVSKLWQDIYNLTGKDFAKSKELYKIATSKTFIDSVRDVAEFDKNGQVTARSFFSLSGRGEEIDDIQARLNDEYSLTTNSVEESLSAIEKFNSKESYKEDYVPTISQDEDKISVTISDRNTNTVDDLEKKLYDFKLTRLISSRLKELGVAYDFVGKSQHAGRFSTKNAEKMSDSLYHLIELSNGSDVNDVLVEEAAHLATVSMKDNDLIQRLLSFINEKTIRDLFSDEELQSAQLNTEQGKLELAGILVKKAFQKKRVLGLDKFLSRIKSAIFNVFSKGKLEYILSDKKRAKLYARQIANGFLYNDNMIDIDSAIKNNNVTELFSIELSGTNKLLLDTFKRLSVLSSSVRNSSEVMWRTLLSELDSGKILKGRPIDSLSYEEAAGFVASGISNLTDSLVILMKELSSVDFNNEINQEEVVSLQTAVEVYSALKDLTALANDYLNDNPDEDTEIVKEIKDSINQVYSTLETSDAIPRKLLGYQRLVSAQIFSAILGKDSYHESARIVLNKLSVEVRNERTVSTKTLATKYINERKHNKIDQVTDYIRHSNNSTDVTTQIFYQAIRRLKINEARAYAESLSELKALRKEVSDAKINVVDFYEKYEDGSFTGNLIGKYNLSQFESDKEAVLNQIKLKFIQELKDGDEFDEFMAMTKQQKSQVFEDYRNTQESWKNFLELAYADVDTKTLSDKYINRDYERLVSENKDFERLLNKIKAFKNELDQTCLCEGIEEDDDISGGYRHYVQDRIPQYSGTLMERYRNRKLVDADLYDERHVNTINLDITSDQFGSPITDTKLDDFNDTISLTDDAVRRIPLYGINKLSDMRNLSTDLFGLLAVYSGMAHRYHTTQMLYPQLKIVDSTLKQRSTGHVVNNTEYAMTQDSAREKMLDDFVTGQKKKQSKFVRGLTVASMLAAIRVLCINIMSALKNWGGGYRVALNDVLAGNADVSLKEFLKATARNFNPIHFASQIATITTNKTQRWDKYQNLIRRWDAARNPHVHITFGEKEGRKVFNYITNVIMSNYSITDESLIAIIYDSHMNSPTFWDASNGKKIKLGKDGYTYNSEKNPELKKSIVKNKKDIAYWRYLSDAISAIEYIIENNASDDEVKLDLSDRSEISNLLDYVENIRKENIDIYNEDGTFKSVETVKNILEKEIEKISFTEEDEVKLCEQINDYITSSQGLYGALNSNAIQSDAFLSVFGKLKGWLFGFIQRNMLSNSSILLGDYKNSVLGSELLALGCILGNTKHITQSSNFIDNFKFKTAVIAAAFIPFSVSRTYDQKIGSKKDKELRAYLQRMGWSPDQLNKLSFFTIGWFIQFAIRFISSKVLSRGNYKKYGEYIYKYKDKRTGKPKKLEEKGYFFPDRLITFNEEKYIDRLQKWEKQGYPYSLNQKREPNGIVDTYKSLPPVSGAGENDLYYVLDSNTYYKPDSKTGRWKETSYGYYIPGTEEYNEHIDAMRYMQYGYKTNSIEYGLIGACYRLCRGIQDEGESLMNPVRMLQDYRELADPILYSAGVGFLWDFVKKAATGQTQQATEKEINFWLKKFGLELDGSGYPIINEYGEKPITMIDWYDQQERVDRYQMSQARR